MKYCKPISAKNSRYKHLIDTDVNNAHMFWSVSKPTAVLTLSQISNARRWALDILAMQWGSDIIDNLKSCHHIREKYNKGEKKTRFTKDDKKKEIFANIDFCLRLSFELLNETIYISIFSLWLRDIHI